MVEQRDECLGGVSMGSKAGKEVMDVGEFFCRIRAEGVDSVAIANDQSREDSRGDGRNGVGCISTSSVSFQTAWYVLRCFIV